MQGVLSCSMTALSSSVFSPTMAAASRVQASTFSRLARDQRNAAKSGAKAASVSVSQPAKVPAAASGRCPEARSASSGGGRVSQRARSLARRSPAANRYGPARVSKSAWLP